MYGLIGFCGLFAQSFLGLFADYFLTVLTITSMPKEMCSLTLGKHYI